MTRQTVNFVSAILDGLTGAGLFRRLSYPGAPRYAVDPRPLYQIESYTPGLQNLKDRAQSKRSEEIQYLLKMRMRENVEETTQHGRS
jgi:hypothetical protein